MPNEDFSLEYTSLTETVRHLPQEAIMSSQREIKAFIQIVSIIALGLLSACAEESMSPPNVEKKAQELEIHGDVRVDDYYWLREREIGRAHV